MKIILSIFNYSLSIIKILMQVEVEVETKNQQQNNEEPINTITQFTSLQVNL